MKTGGKIPVSSSSRVASRRGRGGGPAGAAVIGGSFIGAPMTWDRFGSGASCYCVLSGWPANFDFLDLRILAQSEMQPPVVLSAEAAAAGDLLHLLLGRSRRA